AAGGEAPRVGSSAEKRMEDRSTHQRDAAREGPTPDPLARPRLAGKRIALLVERGMHEHEFWVPYYRFKEEGASVIVCGPKQGVIYQGEGRHGLDGLNLARTDANFEEVDAGELDALVIPGGIYGPLALRAKPAVLDLVRAMDRQGKVIGAICHGQW